MTPGQKQYQTAPVFLEWDSEHFGFPIGKAIWSGDVRLLEDFIAEAEKREFTLVYVIAPCNKELPTWVFRCCAGVFVSQRVDFEKKLTGVKQLESASEGLIELTPASCDMNQVHQLGLVAGQYSRFIRDLRFPRHKAERVFCIWSEDSVRGRLADVTFGVVDASGQLRGFITAKREDKVARIGLLAVTPQDQGRGIGKRLLAAIEDWCVARNLTTVRVATQGENAGACAFYERHGYRAGKRQNVFHLWLKEPSSGDAHES